MRVLLDENLPSLLARELPGHEVRTVARMRWSGIKNGDLLRRAAREFDVFITLDKSIEHQQTLPEGLAMITLRVSSSRPETVVAKAADILAALHAIQPGTNLVIA